jgi:hypothetical protein
MTTEIIPHLTRSFEAKIDDVSTPRRTVTARINTNSVDRYSTVIVPKGGDWSNFMRSGPAVLWEHGNDPNRGRLPVAHCSSLKYRKPDDDILGVMQFKGDDFSSQLLEHYASGTLRSFSVEFLPDPAKSSKPSLEEVRANPGWRDAHTIYRKWELTGFSAVSYPGNPEALALAVERGLWVPEETMRAIEERSKIKKIGDEWGVYSDEGELLAKHKTKADAYEQLKAIYYHKKKEGKESAPSVDDEDGDEEDTEEFELPEGFRSRIKKIGDEWGVYSDEGDLLGKHKTKADAVQQLQAIYWQQGKEKEKKKSAPLSPDVDLAGVLIEIRDQLRAMSEGNGSKGGYTTKKKKEDEKPGDQPDDVEPDADEDDELVKRYITKEGDQFVVHAEDGKVLGKHKTKAEAVAQLQAIEANKHKKGAPDALVSSSPPLPVVQTYNLNELQNRLAEANILTAKQLIPLYRSLKNRDLDELGRGRV